MKYLKVHWWHHLADEAKLADEPTLIYSELDDARWETRKVEIFRNGFMGYATQGVTGEPTGLSLEPIPSLSHIAAIPEFSPIEITREEFEDVWRRATEGGSHQD